MMMLRLGSGLWEVTRNVSSTLSPSLFALAMDILKHHIQGLVPWFMLFARGIVLIDNTRGGLNTILEV